MPYIVVTKRHAALAFGETALMVESRRAVATLEEARHAAHDVMLDRAGEAEPVWPEGSNAANWAAVDALPESGGTIALPDGTVIEVEAISPLRLSALARVSGDDLMACVRNGHDYTPIIAAFNAQASGQGKEKTR